MTIPRHVHNLDKRMFAVGVIAVVLMTMIAVWGVQQVYGYSTARTTLATHEFTDDVIIKTRVYHNYQDFTEDGVTSRYTYLFAKAIEDCFHSTRIALFDSAGEAAGGILNCNHRYALHHQMTRRKKLTMQGGNTENLSSTTPPTLPRLGLLCLLSQGEQASTVDGAYSSTTTYLLRKSVISHQTVLVPSTTSIGC